jgi:hypothetical protein
MTRLDSTITRKLAAQSRGAKVLEASAAVTAIAVAAFWFGLVASPKPVEAGAGAPGLDPEQIALGGSRELPTFDDTYQRHMGVLDRLTDR